MYRDYYDYYCIRNYHETGYKFLFFSAITIGMCVGNFAEPETKEVFFKCAGGAMLFGYLGLYCRAARDCYIAETTRQATPLRSDSDIERGYGTIPEPTF